MSSLAGKVVEPVCNGFFQAPADYKLINRK